jgi:Pan3 Pseudokinase domain
VNVRAAIEQRWLQVLLLSRDEESMLVVSYADVRRCLEGAYNELRAMAAPGSRPHSRG